jgi:MFS family permease
MKIFHQPKQFYSILFSWFFSAFSFASLLPFLSIFLMEKFHLSLTEIGYFFLFTAIFRGILQIYIGDLSDLIGRKNLILYSQYFRAMSLFFLINFIENQILVILFLGLGYVFSSLYQPLASSALSDNFSQEKFLKAFSVVRVFGNIPWALAPFITGKLASISIENIFYISAIASILSNLVIHFFFEDKLVLDIKENREPIQKIFQDKKFILFCFAGFLLCITISQMFSSLNVFFSEEKKLSKEEIGIIFSMNGLVVSIFQIPISGLISKFINSFLAISIGTFLYFLGYYLAGSLNQFYEYLLILVLISFAENFTIPTIQTNVKKFAKEKMTGRYMGFYSMVTVAGWSVGPFFGGKILEFTGKDFSIALKLISISALFSSISFFSFYLKDKKV